ncbi:MAG: Gfo/Idh/MocA family oxidoreductase [Chloroflexi bacterium]|nr:Gfo/Idh/MocA family oxidoreductase [Chloroflexota bacterium]
MARVPIAIVGCGGMGGRHLYGLQELYGTDMCNVELVAACDLRRENAELLADNAAKLLGKRPLVFTDMAEMVRAIPDLQAVDITTDSGSHHVVATAAFDLGLHVMCEKPLALTIRGCNLILEAQKRAGKILSVAEQYRRDPMRRLVKALIDAEAIGRPYILFEISAGGGNQIIIWPWRHYKHIGGIVVDAGVHTCDVMQYYLGAPREVMARTGLYEKIRYKGERLGVQDFYRHWYAEVPDQITATAEDMLMSMITFESGVIAQWTTFVSAHGKGFGQSVLYGSRGSLHDPGSRNGRPVVLHLDGQGELSGDAVLDLVPDFHLDEVTAKLFGGDRLGHYEMGFPAADRKLVALEYQELGACILEGKQPEVDGLVGRKALAMCNAALESGVVNRTVRLDEIEEERTAVYEAEINRHWGI